MRDKLKNFKATVAEQITIETVKGMPEKLLKIYNGLLLGRMCPLLSGGRLRWSSSSKPRKEDFWKGNSHRLIYLNRDFDEVYEGLMKNRIEKELAVKAPTSENCVCHQEGYKPQGK